MNGNIDRTINMGLIIDGNINGDISWTITGHIDGILMEVGIIHGHIL